jgi:hypothetical protein
VVVAVLGLVRRNKVVVLFLLLEELLQMVISKVDISIIPLLHQEHLLFRTLVELVLKCYSSVVEAAAVLEMLQQEPMEVVEVVLVD